jgi:FtsX-like permease family
VRRLRLTQLGVGLAVAGGRPAWIRLGLMAVGFAVGGAMLLGAMSIVPAMHARDVRQFQQYARGKDRPTPDSLAMWYTPQAYGSLDIDAQTVRAIGDAPVPPGLARVPGAGELFVSPRLLSLWAGPLGSTLERRLGAHVVGTISLGGLVSPDDLTMWIGAPATVPTPRGAMYATSFHHGVYESQPLDLGAILGMSGLAAAILLPIWLFVATATRLSSSTREARLAAIRLAGGTQSQVRTIAAAETAVAACVGALCAYPLFVIVRPRVAGGFILNIHLFPSDLAPPVGLAVATLLALPVLAAVMTLVTMRRLIVTPLGVARKSRRSHASWRWAGALVGGVAMLAWAASRHEQLVSMGSTEASVLIIFGLAATAFGLIGTASWASWALATRLAPRMRSVWGVLGMRRLGSDPSGVGRVVASVALLVASIAVMQAGLISQQHDANGYLALGSWTDRYPRSTIFVSFTTWPPAAPLDLARSLRTIAGVDAVRATRHLPTGGINTRLATLIVSNDGDPATLESVRDRIVWTAEAHTFDQLRDEAAVESSVESMRRALTTIAIFLFAVCGATLLIALVDWMMERRRALAVLSAVGVSGSVMRRSILAQVGVPLVTALVLGAAGGIVVSVLLYTAPEIPVVIPLATLATAAVAIGVVVLAVTGLSLPWVRVLRRPEYLREA